MEFLLVVALSRFVGLLNLTVSCARSSKASSLSHTLSLSNNRFTQFCAWLRCVSLRVDSFRTLALHICYQSYFTLRRFCLGPRTFICVRFLLRFRSGSRSHSLSDSRCCCVGCGAYVLLFSSITVSFAALRLFCCFAFCFGFCCCCCMAMLLLLLLLLVLLCHSHKNFIVTG